MNDILNTIKGLIQTAMAGFGVVLILIIMLIWGTSNSIYKTFKKIELNFVEPMNLPKENTTGYFIFDITKNKDFNSDSLLSAAKKNPIILTGGVQITIETFSLDSEIDTGDDKNKIINLYTKNKNNLYAPIECISLIKEKNKKIYERITDDTKKIYSRCKSKTRDCILTTEKNKFDLKDLENNSCQNIIELPEGFESEPTLEKNYLIDAHGNCKPKCPTNVENQIYSYKSTFMSSELISRAFELEILNEDILNTIGALKNLDSLLFDAYECMKEDNDQCAKKYLKKYIYISSIEEDKKTAKLAIDIIDCKALVNEICSPETAKELVKNNTEKSGKQKLKLELEKSLLNAISYKISDEKPTELQTINMKESEVQKINFKIENSIPNEISNKFSENNSAEPQRINQENDKIKDLGSEDENSISNINLAKELTENTKNNSEIEIISSPVYTASFDCNKASIPSEKIICNSSKLSTLDIELSKTYKEVRMISSNTEKLKHEQIQFIKLIRACSDNESCIQENYSKRIFELKKYLR
jgi:uncharacterized protein YecT (DUF1311 family)